MGNAKIKMFGWIIQPGFAVSHIFAQASKQQNKSRFAFSLVVPCVSEPIQKAHQ
jgi:hypothetical protein